MVTYSYQKGFSWGHVLLVLALVFILAAIIPPFILVEAKQGALTEAGNNAKNVASALNLFRHDFGCYPDQKIREMLVEKGYDHLPEGDHANAHLAQLIVAGYLDSETSFFVPKIDGIEKGDDRMTPGKFLAAGENGFAYIMAEGRVSLSSDKAITPLVVAPAIKGGRVPLFDPAPFGGKYVYGAIDGTSKQGDVGDDGLPLSKGRAHLFETGSDSLFGSDIPVVKMPLRK